MLITVEGVVTKAINIGENDKLIAVLTKDRGLIYAFINNCKKIQSRMLAASEICSYCKFVLLIVCFICKKRYLKIPNLFFLKINKNSRVLQGFLIMCVLFNLN